MSTTAPSDLEARIDARRIELIEKLAKLKSDTRREEVALRARLKAKLSDLARIIEEDVVKDGVGDSWESLTEPTKRKLDRWLTT
jgi:hypothetical protein